MSGSVDDIFAEFVEGEKKEQEEKAKPAAEPKTAPEPEVAKEPEGKEEPKEQPKQEQEQPKQEQPSEIDQFFEGTKEEEKPAEEAPKPETKPEPKPTVEEKFDAAEDKGSGKLVFVIYGMKGEGKTYLAFSLPGTIACLSFDRKSLSVKKEMFANDERIKVFDSIRYLDQSSPEKYLESADRTFRYQTWLIDQLEFEPDWVVIDGTEILQRVCEMTMRFRNNVMPFQGIANRNLWKERRMYINQVHNRAIKASKYGVIYTTYVEKNEIIKDGEFIAKEDVPRWVDAVMYETDIVIRSKIEVGADGVRDFFGTVNSSKSKKFPTGTKKKVTDVGIKALIAG